jgi:hypothetical protein
MNKGLAQALLERGIINSTTRVIARCPVQGMGGAPVEKILPLNIQKVIVEDDEMKFISSHRDGRRFAVPAEQILEIDGMNPVRLAAAYDIKATGDIRAAGKKRGRKPRINIPEQHDG